VDQAVVNASFAVHDLVALRAGYARGQTDDFPVARDPSGDPDVSQFLIGLRPHYSLTKHLDAFGDLVYTNSKFNGDRSHTDLGYIYAAGVRYQAFKRVELRLAGEYRSGDIDEAFLVVEPVIRLTRTFDLSLRTSQSSDSSDYFAGLRLNF
jgi:opacity protein-like surface antigen